MRRFTIKLTVRYFASLREQADCDHEDIDIGTGTYGDLYDHLRTRHGFSLPASIIQVAVNDEFSRLDAAIQPGATVVFIPPVAGG